MINKTEFFNNPMILSKSHYKTVDVSWYLVFIIFLLEVNKYFIFLEINKIFYAILIFLLLLFIAKRKKIDIEVFAITFYWLLINLIGASLFPNNAKFDDLRISIITIINGYLATKLLGISIFIRLEKLILVLAIISLPIFTAQLLAPDYFMSLGSYLNIFTFGEPLKSGDWNIFLYNFSSIAKERNCGFMWEPGAFAFMLVLAQIVRFNNNNYKFDRYSIIYLIAIITTFSTMGYLAYAVLIVTYLKYNQRKKFYYLLLIPFFVYFFYESYLIYDFLGKKMENYIFDVDLYYYTDKIYGGIFKYNRLGYFIYAITQSTTWPFGYGVFTNFKFTGVGTLSDIILSWGWIGLFFFIYQVYRVVCILSIKKIKYINILVSISILSAFFSNPFANSFIAFLFVFYPLHYKKLIIYDKYTKLS